MARNPTHLAPHHAQLQPPAELMLHADAAALLAWIQVNLVTIEPNPGPFMGFTVMAQVPQPGAPPRAPLTPLPVPASSVMHPDMRPLLSWVARNPTHLAPHHAQLQPPARLMLHADAAALLAWIQVNLVTIEPNPGPFTRGPSLAAYTAAMLTPAAPPSSFSGFVVMALRQVPGSTPRSPLTPLPVPESSVIHPDMLPMLYWVALNPTHLVQHWREPFLGSADITLPRTPHGALLRPPATLMMHPDASALLAWIQFNLVTIEPNPGPGGDGSTSEAGDAMDGMDYAEGLEALLDRTAEEQARDDAEELEVAEIAAAEAAAQAAAAQLAAVISAKNVREMKALKARRQQEELADEAQPKRQQVARPAPDPAAASAHCSAPSTSPLQNGRPPPMPSVRPTSGVGTGAAQPTGSRSQPVSSAPPGPPAWQQHDASSSGAHAPRSGHNAEERHSALYQPPCNASTSAAMDPPQQGRGRGQWRQSLGGACTHACSGRHGHRQSRHQLSYTQP